jgi:hypothetical protein
MAQFQEGLMIDRYTKVVLTVIAACLVALVFKDHPTVTPAFAQRPVHVVIDEVDQFAFRFTTVPVEIKN